MKQNTPVEKKPGKPDRKPAIPTQNIKKPPQQQPAVPPTQQQPQTVQATDKKVKQATVPGPEQESEQKEQLQIQQIQPQQQIQQISSQPELGQVEQPSPNIESQLSTSSQDQIQTQKIETQDSKLPEMEAIISQQLEEINQLKSSLDLVSEDLKNTKSNQALLQQINTDLRSQVSLLKKRAEQLEKEKQQGVPSSNNDEEIDELNDLVEKLTMDRDNYQHKYENLKKQYDEQNEQLKNLQYEKEITELTLQEAILTGGSNLEPEEGNQNKELVNMNNQLRQALNQVTKKLNETEYSYEAEQLELLQQIESLKIQADKVKILDKLQIQIEQKDKIIEELSQRIDDLQALTEMTEQLTDSMIRKDDEIAVLKSNRKELIELRKYDEEYLNELEDILKKRTSEIKSFESDLIEKTRTLQIQQKEIEERETINNRLKQKIGQLSKELDLVKEDQTLPEQNQNQEKNNQVSKAQELLLKCQEIQGQRRDMQKRYFDLLIQNSQIRNEVLLKSVLLINSMPQDYQQKLKFQVIDYIIVVRKVGELSQFLAEEFIQIIDNNAEIFIKEENSDFGFWIIDVLKNLYDLSNLSQTVSLAFENANKIEQVERSSKNNVLINQFRMAGQAVEQILVLLKEDSLTSRESISGLKMLITHIREDVSTLLEQSFTEFSQSVEYKSILIRQKLCKTLTTLMYWHFNGKVIRDLESQKQSQKGPFLLEQLIDTLYKRLKIQLKVLSNYRQSWGTFEIFVDKYGINYDNLDKILGETNQIIDEHLKTDTHEVYLTGKGNEENLQDVFYSRFRDSIISLVHNLNILNSNLGEKNSSIEDILESFSSSK